jgi:hypothetical protein
MRKFIIVFCVTVALPSGVFAAGVSVAALETMIGYLSRSMGELKALAASARVISGTAKEEALLRGRAELFKLKPIFRDAQQEAERVQQQALIEKWRERADRVSDFVEAIKKVEELKELAAERDQLQDEFCGPRDPYRFSGDC